jgi:hypothetical protein
MKSERSIEKFLKRIDVVPDAERKRLRLEELLEVRDKAKRTTSADVQPTNRRLIMNRQIWKVAASLVIIATVIGVVGILQNGNQAAYAFEQTVAAMQGKRSFHIQTYYDSPTKLHDEFWAEFDEHGKVIRVRQIDKWKKEDWPVEVLWDNQVKHKYKPGVSGPGYRTSGILVICKTRRHVDENKLEEFDPETIIEEIKRDVEKGVATLAHSESQPQGGHLVVEVTGNNYAHRRVMLVDPKTKLVLRMDNYDQDDEGNYGYHSGIEVLEYNQPFDPNLFKPNFPADTVVIDQLSRKVGMAQGDLSKKDIAYEVSRKALEAWAAAEYETAGPLFGGAPPKFFEQRPSLKPVADIVIAEVRPVQWYGPTFKVNCSYMAEQEGELKKILVTLWVKTGEGQPDRWFIDPLFVTRWLKEWGKE